jgi:hypothetical protein
MIGGNIAGCAIGILVGAGSVNTIHGVSLQNQTDCDIYIINGAGDSYSIAGCRSESTNFLRTAAAQPYSVSGCNQVSSTPGFFFSGSGMVTLQGCGSVAGLLDQNPRLVLNNCDFQRSDYLTGSLDRFTYLDITPMPITTQTGATYSFKSWDGGTKVKFNRATGQTVTINKSSDNTLRLIAGSRIEVQQIGAGQTTFAGASGVTLHSSNGLKLRAQWSCATLVCDGADEWTLTGDTTP